MDCRQIRFQIGKIVATPGALQALSRCDEQPETFLCRHQTGDWGNLCDEDKQSNDEAIAHEGDPDRRMRLLSAYRLRSGQMLWIITEASREVTTLLLPEDY